MSMFSTIPYWYTTPFNKCIQLWRSYGWIFLLYLPPKKSKDIKTTLGLNDIPLMTHSICPTTNVIIFDHLPIMYLKGYNVWYISRSTHLPYGVLPSSRVHWSAHTQIQFDLNPNLCTNKRILLGGICHISHHLMMGCRLTNIHLTIMHINNSRNWH